MGEVAGRTALCARSAESLLEFALETRPRSVHLRVARSGHPQHSRLREGLHGREGNQARTKLSFDSTDPIRRKRRHLEQCRTQEEEPLHGSRRGYADPLLRSGKRPGRGAVRDSQHPRFESQRGRSLRTSGDSVSNQCPVPRLRRRAAEIRRALYDRGRPAVL